MPWGRSSLSQEPPTSEYIYIKQNSSATSSKCITNIEPRYRTCGTYGCWALAVLDCVCVCVCVPHSQSEAIPLHQVSQPVEQQPSVGRIHASPWRPQLEGCPSTLDRLVHILLGMKGKLGTHIHTDRHTYEGHTGTQIDTSAQTHPLFLSLSFSTVLKEPYTKKMYWLIVWLIDNVTHGVCLLYLTQQVSSGRVVNWHLPSAAGLMPLVINEYLISPNHRKTQQQNRWR